MLIPRTVLSTLAKSTDANSSRYATAGVRIERTAAGPVAVATDGRHLIVAEWREQAVAAPYLIDAVPAAPVDGFSAIVPARDCDRLARANRPKAKDISANPQLASVLISEQSDNAQLTAAASDGRGSARVDLTRLDGRFPDWRGVIPACGDDSVQVTLDAEYVLRVAQAAVENAKDSDGYSLLTLSLSASNPSESAVKLVAETPDCTITGVIAPLFKAAKRTKPAPAKRTKPKAAPVPKAAKRTKPKAAPVPAPAPAPVPAPAPQAPAPFDFASFCAAIDVSPDARAPDIDCLGAIDTTQPIHVRKMQPAARDAGSSIDF